MAQIQQGLETSYRAAHDGFGFTGITLSSPDGQINGDNGGASNSSVALTFAEPTIDAGTIYQMTIESSGAWIAGTPVSLSSSCDNQITVTPYSRIADGYQALNRVDMSNLDLTPQGSNFALAGYATKEEVLLDHPGQ